ncbi:hypothetical protein AJ80_05998 [Polytolypa hystricis UAMH7299]|uniref:Uncharacterized protein n=1 Tax=Polytolypa hystricis (strain UAMH7299) TaxID=1447883 RepID=A0A2B7Y0C2_POLH7|nr:hypothetical protein AJ80_05998 [Polytolypa hystricis UAMH7299]
MSLGPGDRSLKLPILKFSYATTSVERTSPLGWTHISGSGDMFAIFDFGQKPEASGWTKSQRHLRLLRGSEILENLDLDSLARESANESLPSGFHTAKRSVAVIVKSPCLAIRYPTRFNQTRRFQIKFPSDADFYKAMSALSEAGCRITDSNLAPVPLPSLAAKPCSPAFNTNTSLPLSPYASSSVDGYNSRPASTSATETSSLARPRGLSAAPNTCLEALHPDGETLRCPILLRPSSLTSLCSPRRDSQSMNDISRISLTTADDLTASQLSRALLPDLNVSQQSNEQHILEEGPSTAPSLEIPSLSQILPPKRVLPFAKPEAKRTRRAPTDKTTSAPSLSVGSTKSHSLGSNVQRTSSVVGGILDSQATVASSIPNEDRSTNYDPPSGSRAASSELPYRRILPQEGPRHDTPTASPAAVSIAYQPPQTLTTSATSTITSISNHSLNAPNRTIQSPEPADNVMTSDNLSTYLSTPAPERHALLDSYICGQLDNDAFLTLCQDVEGVWKRIAFGH